MAGDFVKYDPHIRELFFDRNQFDAENEFISTSVIFAT